MTRRLTAAERAFLTGYLGAVAVGSRVDAAATDEELLAASAGACLGRQNLLPLVGYLDQLIGELLAPPRPDVRPFAVVLPLTPKGPKPGGAA